MLIDSALKGSIGRVAKVYKDGQITLSVLPRNLVADGKKNKLSRNNWGGFTISPDGTYHWVAHPGEYEIVGEQKGVF